MTTPPVQVYEVAPLPVSTVESPGQSEGGDARAVTIGNELTKMVAEMPGGIEIEEQLIVGEVTETNV